MTVDHDSTPAGQRMIAELQYAHASLRADLVVLEHALAMLSDVARDHGAVPEMINGLTVANFAWQLGVRCDYYCNHLTLHHTVEDRRMFPAMLRQFPELAPHIDHLKAQHDQIGGLVNEAKSASLHLSADQSVSRAYAAIEALGTHLRQHLDDEENVMFPRFRRMTQDWHVG